MYWKTQKVHRLPLAGQRMAGPGGLDPGGPEGAAEPCELLELALGINLGAGSLLLSEAHDLATARFCQSSIAGNALPAFNLLMSGSYANAG